MSIIQGRSPDGETAAGTNPVLMGYEDESGNAKRVASGNGMPVQVSGSTTHITTSDSILIGTGAAHSAGDVVSTDVGEILEFDLSGKIDAGGSGIIMSSLVTLDNSAVFSGGAGYTLYLFNAVPTAQATNAAYDVATADIAKQIGQIEIGALTLKTSTCSIYTPNHNMDFNLAAGSQKIYGKLVCKGGETTVTGKTLTIYLGVATL